MTRCLGKYNRIYSYKDKEKTTTTMTNSEITVTAEQVMPRLSPPLQRKLRYSIQLLQKAERIALAYDKDDGYFLAFSGGKDSQALYHVARMAGVMFKAHMSLTSVDPPEVIRFVRHEYPDVDMVRPKDSIYHIALKKKSLPTMRVRWCCAEFKESAGAGKVTLIGIRHEESARRKKRNEVELSNRKYSGSLQGLEQYRQQKTGSRNITNADSERTLGCIRDKESLLISPIIRWTAADVWQFLHAIPVSHCTLYDEGYTRIGCILCPMSQPRQKQREVKRWPHVKRNWVKTIKRLKDEGKYSKHLCSAEDDFRWWISGKSYKQFYADEFMQGKFNFKDNNEQ